MQEPTTLLVSHRLSTLADADRILVLERGRQVGLGTHEELREDCPLYNELWRAQLLGETGARPARGPGEPEKDLEPEGDDAFA
jgi:ABC-type transport system involved in cytochrome bd biosynthesis fused ATPase/permease subunit